MLVRRESSSGDARSRAAAYGGGHGGYGGGGGGGYRGGRVDVKAVHNAENEKGSYDTVVYIGVF
jgi:hypothetical protein